MLKKNKTLMFSLIKITIFSIFITSSIFYFVLFKAEVSNQTNLLQSRINQISNKLSSDLGYPLWNYIDDEITKNITEELKLDYVGGIVLNNAKGEIIKGFYKNDDNMIIHLAATSEDLKKFKFSKRKKIYYNNQFIGELEIFASDKQLKKVIKSYLMFLIIIALSMIIFSTVIIILLFKNSILKQLNNIKNGITELNNGNYDYEIPEQKYQEFNIISNHINIMARTIKKREKEISHIKNYLNNIVESMPSVLISIDENYKITQWNKTAQEVFKSNKNDVVGKKIWKVIPQFNSYKNNIFNVMQTKEEEIIYKKNLFDEVDRLYNIILYPLIANGVRGIVIRCDDVSELEKKQMQLEQAQKLETIGTLAGGLAHDFNNILNGIFGPISIMKTLISMGKEITATQINKYLTLMDSSANRAKDIVKQILMLSHKYKVRSMPVNLNDTILNIQKIATSSFDKIVDLDFEISHEDAVIQGDPTQIEQVFLNLIINAYHAMTIMQEKDKRGGTLYVTVSKFLGDNSFCNKHLNAEKGLYWKVSIEDSGVGIDKETMKKIFNPFFTTKGKGVGTGLGLAMVYNIIYQHKGFIDVYSEKGKGTKVNVYFPRYSEIIKERKSETYSIAKKNDASILFVDDEELNRTIAADILTPLGYKLTFCSNGEDALEIYNSDQKFDLVLLDIVMPKLSGDKVFWEMYKKNKDQKIIIMSGLRISNELNKIFEETKASFMSKPFTFQSLTSSIQEKLGED